MTKFQHFRSTTFMRMAANVALCAMVATLPAIAQRGGKGGDNDPDRVLKGGNFPAGWNARPDRGSADQINFTETGGVMHLVMGPASTFYNNGWTKSGNYSYSARLTQMKKASHPTSYGIMFGATNMGPSPTYTYFLVRQGGEYFVSNWEGASPKTVVNWTANPAIVKEGADGKQTNTLGVQVQGNDVILSVNGKEVTRLQKSQVHTDGLFGYRIGHNLDIDVDQVKQ
jgi:hypothetical protein